MVPQTEDGRVLFAVPWHDRVLVGTTDTPVDAACLEIAEEVAELMADELGRDRHWRQGQVKAYRELAKIYLPG